MIFTTDKGVSSPARRFKATSIKHRLIVNGFIKLIFICIYIIGHYVIQFIHLLTYRRPSIYISIAITGYWGIGVWLVTGRVAARVAELLGRSWPDILDFLEFTARAGLIGNAKEHLVLILESLQIFLSFFLDFLYCFTDTALLPIGPPSPSLMLLWLVNFPKQSSALCDI